MEDFEKVYEKIYYKYKDKIEEINNAKKDIRKYVLLKLLKIVIIIAIVFLILIFKFKNIEILFLLMFVPGPLLMYYFISKGSKMSNAGVDLVSENNIQDQIFCFLVSDCFDGLQYNNKQGINSEVYDKGKYESYHEYFSVSKIEGVLNNKNKIQMSYVATSNRNKDGVRWIFRGYFLEVELNESTQLQMRINEKNIEYFDDQVLNENNSTIANNIQNILINVKENNKLSSDVTICNDKMYIRVATNDFCYNYSNKILDKAGLEKTYYGISEILGLTDKVIKSI